MSDARAAVLAFARANPSPTRPALRRRRAVVAALAILWSASVVGYMGGVELEPRPVWLAAATGLCALAVTSWTARLVAGFGPRRWTTLAALVVGAPLALLAWKLGVTSLAAGMLDAFPGRVGDRCFVVALAGGAGPFLALLWARRRTVTSAVRWTGAALGCVAGAAGWTVNDIRCQVGEPTHVLLGHVGPLLVFIGLGALLAGWLRPRPVR